MQTLKLVHRKLIHLKAS